MAATALLLTGCFYLDPIITPPGVTINLPAPPNDVPRRGAIFSITAEFDDPKPRHGSYHWNVLACNVSDDGLESCHEIYTGTKRTAGFTVPVIVADSHPVLVNRIKAKLEARDDRGALATAEENLPVDDAPPVLELMASAHTYTIGVPIDLIATYSDADDPPGSLELSWGVTPPTDPLAYTLEDLQIPVSGGADTAFATAGKRLTPGEPGSWGVKVTARDPAGNTADLDRAFTVDPDRPPCLAQWEPIVPPNGTTLPITDPTVFQVLLVDDDLDAYPPVAGTSLFEATTFAWSILPQGAAQRQLLVGATGNGIDFDPSAFTRGDIVELRVEIFDRNHAVIPCDDGAASCSITGSPDCIQRETWRVEVR